MFKIELINKIESIFENIKKVGRFLVNLIKEIRGEGFFKYVILVSRKEI